MDTVRVDICYRPLRIAWAIRAGDMESFRTAARVSFALWGGRFNPIVVVDHQEQAESLIDIFRADAILTIGDSEEVKTFPKKFPHLISPFYHDSGFVGDNADDVYSQVLDLHNALTYLRDKPEWKSIKGRQVAIVCPVRNGGLNIRPPMMHFGTASTLGVIGTEFGKTKVSFSLDNKPFSDETWFHSQTLVASLSFTGGLYADEEHILVSPFVPELNEFYARTMHFGYNKVRSERDRIALVIDACDTTGFLAALPISDLLERIFDLAGFASKLSNGGLIARQLIAQLGGVDGARVFKIPGVRPLLKTHGPRDEFTKKSAVQLIACKDPDNPSTSFKDYEGLYGGHHPYGTQLDPQAVFSYLVEKGLFRIGSKLACPHCRLSSWTALDALKQSVICEMCGREFDATSQLVNGEWHYRRSGVLGAEKNAQGAVPVVLTLQQFKVNMHGFLRNGMYSPSLDLIPKEGTNLPKCEVDFVWLIPENYHRKTVVIIGECKDRGKGNQGDDKGTINATDIDHLKRIADAIPRKRFETFFVLAKLCPFTAEEIALAKTLNDQYRRRAILLTDRELEPYHFYERTKLEYKNIQEHATQPEDLANNTATMYFNG